MKRWLWTLMAVCGTLALLPAGVQPLGAAQADDYGNEPTAFEATLLPPGNVELQGQIDYSGDVDCFMFEGAAGTAYTLEATALNGTLDPLLVLFDRNGRTVLAVDDNGGGDRASRLDFSPSFDGLYFACVRNARATQGVGAYTLRLSSSAATGPATTVEPPGDTPASPPVDPEDTGQPPVEPQPPATPETPETPEPPATEEPARTSPAGASTGDVLREGRIALLGGDSEASIRNVHDYLLATGLFPEVETINVATRTPTAGELNQFEAVLVWAGTANFQDADALGDLLAAYADRGGGVVVAAVSFDLPNPFDPDTLGGRFLDGGYYVIQPDADNVDGDRRVLGTVSNASHPVLQGVQRIDGGPRSLHSPTHSLTPGGSTLASWDNGDVLVAVKTLGQANRVDINLFPPSSLLAPDLWPFTPDNHVPRLIANALLWAAGRDTPFGQDASADPAQLEISPPSLSFDARSGAAAENQSLTLRNTGGQTLNWTATVDVNWLTVTPSQGQLESGQSQAVVVSVAPGSLATGSFSGTVTVTAPGTESGIFRIPVSLALGGTDSAPPVSAPPTGTATAGGRTLRVPAQYQTVAAALAAAAAGDTIEIAAGTYTGVALTLEASIRLRGATGLAKTELRGNGRDPVIRVQGGATAALESLTLTGGQDGLLVDGARATLENSRIRNNLGWGVRLLGASGFSAAGNTIEANGSGGISVEGGGAAVQVAASQNTVQNNGGCGVRVANEDGIQISGSGNRIKDNAVDVCDEGGKLPAGFVEQAANASGSGALAYDDDGDGVPDAQDFCPLTPGRPENNGCP